MQLKNKLLQDPCGMTPEKRSACQSIPGIVAKQSLKKVLLQVGFPQKLCTWSTFTRVRAWQNTAIKNPGVSCIYTLCFLSPPHSELSPLKMYALWAYLCCCLVYFLSFIMTKAFIWMLQIQAGRVSSSVKILCLGLVGCYRVQ